MWLVLKLAGFAPWGEKGFFGVPNQILERKSPSPPPSPPPPPAPLNEQAAAVLISGGDNKHLEESDWRCSGSTEKPPRIPDSSHICRVFPLILYWSLSDLMFSLSLHHVCISSTGLASARVCVRVYMSMAFTNIMRGWVGRFLIFSTSFQQRNTPHPSSTVPASSFCGGKVLSPESTGVTFTARTLCQLVLCR